MLPYSPLQQGLLSGKYRTLQDVPEGRRRTRLFNSKRCDLSVENATVLCFALKPFMSFVFSFSTELSRHGGEGAEDLMFKVCLPNPVSGHES